MEKPRLSLDLGYAPPFSPSYDPILIAADELWKKLEGKRWGIREVQRLFLAWSCIITQGFLLR